MNCGHAGDAFLAVSGSAQIKIYDRDGIERGESLRGDMYIRDQRNTKGNVSPATGGHWSTTDRQFPRHCNLFEPILKCLNPASCAREIGMTGK